MIPLTELFPLEDYRFHLTLRRGDLQEFFKPSAAAAAVLEERRRWLQAAPDRYAGVRPAGEAPLREWARWVEAQQWGTAQSCAELGGLLEPDFVLLVADAGGVHRLEAGAVVFPSSWALEEKMGQTLEWIHGVVPGLNRSLANPIQSFLHRLKPGGPAYLRSNWGFAATKELNLHPSRPRPTLEPNRSLHEIWLRVEHQVLAALPETHVILFGIRLEIVPLVALVGDPLLRAGLHRALRTMPRELADYKGLGRIQDQLIAWSG